MNRPPKISLNNQQIAQAAADIFKLINDDERVNISPSLARSGSLVIMDQVLSSLISGEVVVANPDQLKAEPIGDGEGANED